MTRRDAGFTLVELAAVTLIMGVLLMIAIPQYAAVRARAAEQTCAANRTVVSRAAALYVSTAATSPVSVADIVAAGYLKAAPTCPSGGTYVFSSARTGGNDTLVCSLHP